MGHKIAINLKEEVLALPCAWLCCFFTLWSKDSGNDFQVPKIASFPVHFLFNSNAIHDVVSGRFCRVKTTILNAATKVVTVCLRRTKDTIIEILSFLKPLFSWTYEKWDSVYIYLYINLLLFCFRPFVSLIETNKMFVASIQIFV